jgi:uncharacterized tellurite resistance protein B-like protein
VSFLRFLAPRRTGDPAPASLETETEAVRNIVARLEALPPERARYLAGVAYVLARSANADMDISEIEFQTIQEVLGEAGLDSSQALLVAEMARLQERTSGGTSDFLVTRELRRGTTTEQQLALLDSCHRVAAAEGGISSAESAVLDQIGEELGLDRRQVTGVRARYADRISARFDFKPGP